MKKEEVIPVKNENVIPLKEIKIEEISCCPQCGVLYNREVRSWDSFWNGEKAFCPICSKIKEKDKEPEKVSEEKESGWF
jgi:hypothetical protein